MQSTIFCRARQWVFATVGTLGLCLSHPAATKPVSDAGPTASAESPARAALRRGDLTGAQQAAASDEDEAARIRARVALARLDLESARAALASLPETHPETARLRWQLAHAEGNSEEIAQAAATVCALGDPTLRSCVDASFFAHRRVRPSLSGPSHVEIPMSEEAPFPLVRGALPSGLTGVVIDTGASQTVVSATLAKKLGLALSEKAFPVAVAAGAGVSEAHLAVLPGLQLDGVTVWTIPVLVMDLDALDTAGISVILSPQQVFQGLDITLDFPRSRLILSRDTTTTAMRPAEVEIPYGVAGFDLVVSARVGDGPEALFGLDTGMDAPFALDVGYHDQMARRRGQSASRTATASAARDERPKTSGAVLYGAGGQASVEKTTTEKISLGKMEIHSSDQGFISSFAKVDEIQIGGLLGNALWRDRTLTLDTRRHLIRFGEPVVP